ncbi:MAG: hypothetical protein H6835_19315 [Planctomycetes bacterium]|nr:hypothetical protein [Planctomycetota bacterium]
MDLRRIAAILLPSLLLAPVSGQGPVYRERWGYLHLEHRRAELLEALAGCDDAALAVIGRLLAKPDQGLPFRPVVDALAHRLDPPQDTDEAARLRGALSVFVLPEVVDPESTVEECRRANFSAFLPFAMPVPNDVVLTFVVRDHDGEQVFRAEVDKDTDLEGLRMARPIAVMPTDDVADGTYEVEVLMAIAGAAPREGRDCRLRWSFAVMRGYQQRVEAALLEARSLRDGLDPLPRALLDGMALQVQRAYTGEAYEVRSDAVRELELLELALKNLADAAPVLRGMTGAVSTALPCGELSSPCRLRLPADPDRVAPLVLFASATPAYDITGRRPTEPSVCEGRDLEAALGDFARDGRFHVACMGSPGGGRPFAEALLAALEALPKLLPTGGRKPLLVCDREAAAVVGLRVQEFAPHLAGLVLVGAGGMSQRGVAAADGLPVRIVRLAGYPASESLTRLHDFAVAERTAGRPAPDVARLDERELPWLFGVPLCAAAIEAFAAELFRDS